MVIFHSYVNLPEGIYIYFNVPFYDAPAGTLLGGAVGVNGNNMLHLW